MASVQIDLHALTPPIAGLVGPILAASISPGYQVIWPCAMLAQHNKPQRFVWYIFKGLATRQSALRRQRFFDIG